MDRIDICLMKEMLLHAADTIIENEPYLTEIDTVIGDGDHGHGMKRGFSVLKKYLKETETSQIDSLCRETGLELLKSMGGASGVIFGTMFIGGAGCLPHGTEASLDQIAEYFVQGEQAIERRGRTKPGQKTMLDALMPAVSALKISAGNAEDMGTAFRKAAQAAWEGAQQSRILKGSVGRSKNFKEAAIGLPDPGAVSVSLIFKAFSETMEKEEAEN